MPKRCLESEDIHPAADRMLGVGMTQLVGMEMNLRLPSQAAHPLSNRLPTQRTVLPV
jgi:hypothetical protein